MIKKSMRLLFVGDENVGKSTLISTIYSELSLNIDKTHRRVILPPQMCLYSKQIFTELIDTSAETDFKTQIEQSDLILLIYDISDPQTIQRIQSVWLSKVAAIKPKVPVILVGNKIDVKEHQYESQYQYKKVKQILKKVTKHYKNVQMGIQCSAFYDRNVRSVLNCAQRAVLYPLSPLYDLEHKMISQDFQKAMIRIFRILDKDLDGKIYDSEMNNLQERVFQSQLNLQDLKAIKQIIIRQLKVDYHDYIQLPGFLALQKKCIDMLKIQICWSILRYFNYDDNLRIVVKNQHFSLSPIDSIQLSNDTVDFLLKLYQLMKYQCKNKSEIPKIQIESQMISYRTDLIDQIFASSPWIRFPQFDTEIQITEQKFLLNWQLYAFVDYEKCYQDLLYLGYQKQIDETFIKKTKKNSFKSYEKLKQDKVFTVLIVSSKKYQSYTESLFHDGHKITLNNGNLYSRNSCLYKGKDFSKMFLLFMVNKNDLPTFFNQDEDTKNFATRIDVIIDFEGQYGFVQNHDIFPLSVLHRIVDDSLAQNRLKALQPPKINYDNFPVQYNHSYHNTFFEIVLQTIHEYQKYLPKDHINYLKREQDKSNKIWAITTAGITVGLIALGASVAKTGNLSSLSNFKFWSK